LVNCISTPSKTIYIIQLSLSLHFYLLYLLLNSCGGNDAFWHKSVFLKESSSFSRKHRILSLQIDMCLPNSPVNLETQSTTAFGDWCRNVCTLYKDTSDLMQHINDTCTRVSQNIEAVSQWKKQLCVCTCACVKTKGHHFERLRNWNWHFSEPTHFSEPRTVYRGKHVVLHPFHRSYLKANKICKSEGTRKVENAYHFWNVLCCLVCQQEAQLSQRDCVTLRLIEYFAKSLNITQGHSKRHCWVRCV